MADGDPGFAIEPLSDRHDRPAFACGVEALDRYFHSHVTQDIRRRIAACNVGIEVSSTAVAGYHTIAASSIPLPDLAPETAKKLPRYPLVPAIRIGRLAVASAFRGRGLGSFMLVDAMTRALRAEIMAFVVVVDAKDDAAKAFYRHHGFVAFASQPMSLYLPLAQVAKRLLPEL